MGDLKLHLREAITKQTDLIRQGTAPPPYFFAFEPSAKAGQEPVQKFASLLGVSALARIFAAMNLVKSAPDHSNGGEGGGHHYNLSNPGEYVAAFNEKAEATINAFTNGPLAAMYKHADGGAAASLELDVTRAELHGMVLPRIFGGLDQAEIHLKELDNVLTGFTSALKPFKLPVKAPPAPHIQTEKGGDEEGGNSDMIHKEDGGSDTHPLPDLKHAVVVNYVRTIDITGGSGGIYIHKPCTRIAIFTVKPEHWAAALRKSPPGAAVVTGSSGHHHDADAAAASATGGPSEKMATSTSNWFPRLGGHKPKPQPQPPKPEDERIKFTLNTTVIELEFDDAKYNANKAKFEGIFKNLAQNDEKLDHIAKNGGLHDLGRATCKIFKAA